MLRAKKPEAVEKKLKLFMYGEAKVGKTTAALQFPDSYIIDAEKGAEEKQYRDLMAANRSEIFSTTDIDEVIAEIRTLASAPHRFHTITIDPVTPLYTDLLEKCEKRVGTEWGRHYGAANVIMKRMVNLVLALDMNVIVTAHAKAEYGDEMKRIGTTFDGWRKLDYLFDLIIQLERRGNKRVAIVKGSRIGAFPDGEVFDWSYAEFQRRYGSIIEREGKPQAFATPEQIAEIAQLLTVVKLPEDSVDKWWSKANVDRWEDMPSETIAKCLTFIKGKLPKETV
jgi:hypothetical protein